MIYPIRLYGDPVLRKKARPVQDFQGLKKLAEDMLETMFEARGVGLAAPQIGLSQRFFVAVEYADEPEGEERPLRDLARRIYVVANPVI
ncbi:peptide deformylase, partial [Acinetobacter baumannii]